MNYENWISLRYFTRKKERFLSVINMVSIVGVAIGVTALIIVIGVMTGFDKELRDKIIGTNSHIIIEKEVGLKDYKALMKDISGIDGVVSSTPYIQGYIFMESGSQAMALNLRGIQPETVGSVTKLDDYLTKGSMDGLADGGILIGSELASYFGYSLGDTMTLIAPASGLSGEGWRYDLTVAGIFTSGKYDYDMSLVLVDLNNAQKIFGLNDDMVKGLSVRVKDVYKADEIKESLYKKIGYSFVVRTWMEANQNFFAALRLEKFAMFVILTLIILVASFNIVSTLIVMVTEKVKDIGILKSIGVPRASIRRIFILGGLAIGVTGTFWGIIGGVSLSLLLKEYQFVKLPQEIYYVDRLPVILELGDILTIVGCAIIISFLATVYPAVKAANLEPVDALRYE